MNNEAELLGLHISYLTRENNQLKLLSFFLFTLLIIMFLYFYNKSTNKSKNKKPKQHKPNLN